MDGPRDYHTKCQLVRQGKTNILCSHLHVESKKIKQSYETKQKQIHRYRKQISACNWGKVSEEKQDTYEYKRNKLLFIQQYG